MFERSAATVLVIAVVGESPGSALTTTTPLSPEVSGNPSVTARPFWLAIPNRLGSYSRLNPDFVALHTFKATSGLTTGGGPPQGWNGWHATRGAGGAAADVSATATPMISANVTAKTVRLPLTRRRPWLWPRR